MTPSTSPSPGRVAVIGDGRVGNALAAALRDAGLHVDGPLGRGATADGADIALLCVPDREISTAAAPIAPGVLVGHCSGASTLAPLAGHEAFALHPLMTITGAGAPLRGAGAAIAASTPRARQAAQALADALGLHAVVIDDDDRAAYHAAASIASNFLVTLEGAAEELLATTGADRALLVALVRATVDNWAADGARAALTGPIARGDEATVARQRDAVAQRTPHLLELFDALAAATRSLAVPEVAA
jgi:predicted short-subunit dehydrogenase-like oxidoreductase (DUF2520 family)